MAPLIQENDVYMSDSEDVFDDAKMSGPLHEPATPSAAPLPSTPRRPRVSFGAMVAVREVMSRYEYTHAELEASWFDQEEMFRMKQTARNEARQLDSGVFVAGTNASTRGLEHRTREGILRKRECRTNAYASVFWELDFQDGEGICDEDAIADAYYIYSEPCAVEAHLIGKQDEYEARAIYEDEMEESSQFLQFDPTCL